MLLSTETSSRDIVVVTVTYGKRTHLLCRLINALKPMAIGGLVIVDNGGGVAGDEKYEAAISADMCPVHLVSQPTNEGSASGFATGLRVARALNAQCVWLMDDDNVPCPNALNVLLRVYNRNVESGCISTAFVSYRPAQTRQSRLVGGEHPDTVFPRQSSFLEFDLRDIPRKIMSRLGLRAKARISVQQTPELIPLPFAPYGGLLVPVGVIDAVGYPAQDLYVYWDDGEYTHRIVQHGFGLALVPESVIADIDDSWGVSVKGQNVFRRLLTASSTFRVFYSVRNQAFFCERHWVSKRSIFLLNRLAFVVLLTAIGFGTGRLRRLGVLLRAISDGHAGRLGEVKSIFL